jgi:hypothetical protein
VIADRRLVRRTGEQAKCFAHLDHAARGEGMGVEVPPGLAVS